MGSLFRSEKMTLCQLFLQSEAAYSCVAELGELGLAEFRDLNPGVNVFQRKFVNEIRRCDEMERKLRYIEKEIVKDKLEILDSGENPEAPQPKEMIDLEAAFEKMENELREVNQNAVALKKNYLELSELKHVLRKTQTFFEERDGMATTESMTRALIGDDEIIQQGPAAMQLGFVAGVISRERLPGFERMLWRVCRGNIFLRQSEIEAPLEDPITGDQVYKSVFIIFIQGDQLKSRVKKICDGFHATLYPCPESVTERREMEIGVMTRIEDITTVLGQTQDHRHRVLVAASKNLKSWLVKVRKIKAIYHTLNLFNLDVTQKCLIAECWVPTDDLETINAALRRGTDRSGSSLPPILNCMSTHEVPPTYNKTNKFTSAFQNLVDSYGVAAYREVNPAPFLIITFPFLFAMMFGDAGHGLIMLLFALWMVLKEKALEAKKITSEIWVICFGGRYIILLMGIFSVYTGMTYNDIFSKPFNIYGSSWKVNLTEKEIMDEKDHMLVPNAYNGHYSQYPYPYGMDPVWPLAENKIAFFNAYKMKISIIFGVVHMSFGVILSIWNHVHFKRWHALIFEFIPQILFLFLLFGYLCFLMFFKWANYYAGAEQDGYPALGPHCAPSILITFINMVLFKYGEKPLEGCEIFMFPNQQILQMVFVVVAVLCVPLLLLGTPLYLRCKHSSRGHRTLESAESTEQVQSAGHGGHGEGEEFDFGEIMIHSGIHTIEYVLGSVSHTASYLRLWALSLAHAQLSDVLWTMVLRIGFGFTELWGSVVLWAIFTAWAVLTVAILILMEGLSAFLHTLRLHWVEFQSKFYGGTGHPFSPFSFKHVMDTTTPGDD